MGAIVASSAAVAHVRQGFYRTVLISPEIKQKAFLLHITLDYYLESLRVSGNFNPLQKQVRYKNVLKSSQIFKGKKLEVLYANYARKRNVGMCRMRGRLTNTSFVSDI
jgi:hypothetical protein